ncbi:MAG: alpha/beta hydrolase [Hyphomicrobiaceae bacterium]|nr:MAG: alpha/beta hydrolase [Hyphomicrobiaceae bacterium]
MAMAQRRLIYLPDTARIAPASIGLFGVSEETLGTPDGERLVMWYAPAKPGRRTFLYFHGNAAGLADRAERVRIMAEEGFGVLMLAYRGYSGSTGSPSEAANVADGKRAYEWLLTRGVKPMDIIIFGESLGSGIAVQVAAEHRIGGMVLDSPYTSLTDVAAGRFPYLPVRLAMLDRYDSLSRIGSLRIPLLIFHGDRDEAVPYDLGLRLFQAAKEPKRMVTFNGFGHLVPFAKGSWDAVRAFADSLGGADRLSP